MPGAIIIKTEIILFIFSPYTWSMSKTWSFRCKIYDKLLLLLMQLQGVLNFFFRERRKTQVTSIGIAVPKPLFIFIILGLLRIQTTSFENKSIGFYKRWLLFSLFLCSFRVCIHDEKRVQAFVLFKISNKNIE